MIPWYLKRQISWDAYLKQHPGSRSYEGVIDVLWFGTMAYFGGRWVWKRLKKK